MVISGLLVSMIMIIICVSVTGLKILTLRAKRQPVPIQIPLTLGSPLTPERSVFSANDDVTGAC